MDLMVGRLVLTPTFQWLEVCRFEGFRECSKVTKVQVDERHYNSWYGLGVDKKKFEFWEHHFSKAFRINQQSTAIMCYLGMTLYSFIVCCIKHCIGDSFEFFSI